VPLVDLKFLLRQVAQELQIGGTRVKRGIAMFWAGLGCGVAMMAIISKQLIQDHLTGRKL
jgi:hypothetical protein